MTDLGYPASAERLALEAAMAAYDGTAAARKALVLLSRRWLYTLPMPGSKR